MPGIDDCKTILLIGGTAGIGQALAYALLDLPSKPTVIVGGRRQQRLDEMKRERLETVQVDISADTNTLKTFSEDIIKKYPDVCVFSCCAPRRSAKGVEYRWMPYF
jgi:short-subunit dehydrogenase involved in D-alanine esterification of teichoic acids